MTTRKKTSETSAAVIVNSRGTEKKDQESSIKGIIDSDRFGIVSFFAADETASIEKQNQKNGYERYRVIRGKDVFVIRERETKDRDYAEFTNPATGKSQRNSFTRIPADYALDTVYLFKITIANGDKTSATETLPIDGKFSRQEIDGMLDALKLRV